MDSLYKRCKWLDMVNLFDNRLKSFIDFLKRTGEYEKSVIVLASDHTPHLFTAFDPKEIPFMVLNSGLTYHSEDPIGQIAVFPTILDIMGRLDNSPWPGFGESIFRNRPATIGFGRRFDWYSADTTKHPDQQEKLLRLHQLSDKILKGSKSYFN